MDDDDSHSNRSLPWDFDLAQATREYLISNPNISDKQLFDKLQLRFRMDLSSRFEFIKLVAEALSC